jgi:hypothetical protein
MGLDPAFTAAPKLACTARCQAILCDALVFRVSDQKAIVIVVVDGMADVDIAAAELNAAQFIQFAAIIDTFILGHMLVFTCAAGRGNHISPLRV